MMTTYRAVRLNGTGGLDQLEEVALPLEPPGSGELRIRVRASGVGFTDISKRKSSYRYGPAYPFIEGYEVVGDVDAIGGGVSGFMPGQRVCALTVYGAWAEYFTRSAEDFVAVPHGLDDGEVVALILNYVTAYQMIHRVARMQPGQTALVTGANGGVGTALLELLAVHGVRAIGSVASRHFEFVRSLGAIPIESRVQPLDEAVHDVLPAGVDVAFDGLSGPGTIECVRATRRGGTVVGYGFMAAGGRMGTLRGFVTLLLGARLRRRRGVFYGITRWYQQDKRPFKEDLPKLLELLRSKRIRPRIAMRLPLLAGREAERLLEAGGVTGKIVLVR